MNIRALFFLFLDITLAIACITCGLMLVGSSIGQSAGDMGGLALIAFGIKILATIIFNHIDNWNT